MIYRSWSLLSSTVVIWGGVASLGIAQFFLFGGKELPRLGLPLCSNFFLQMAPLIFSEKLHEYLCAEGERLRQLDKAKISAEKLA
ncbi:hypothetical protein MA16_Dca008996 [Dendrobium catenatum]|uniref:Uncharacterized protein n=1 Tax=Dendrobium catenatum TaxID=906689 RepID=A0A2I0VR82_9ASPA|nr:hypothetical protein MA16_Dca008996 [Dendrobium catenatum]